MHIQVYAYFDMYNYVSIPFSVFICSLHEGLVVAGARAPPPGADVSEEVYRVAKTSRATVSLPIKIAAPQNGDQLKQCTAEREAGWIGNDRDMAVELSSLENIVGDTAILRLQRNLLDCVWSQDQQLTPEDTLQLLSGLMQGDHY